MLCQSQSRACQPGIHLGTWETLAILLLIAVALAHFGPNTFEMRHEWRPVPAMALAVLLLACIGFIYVGSNPPSCISSSEELMAKQMTTDQRSASRRRILLSRIASAVVLICLAFDRSLRLLPPRLFTFRASEALRLYAAGWVATFA
ncbi:MAG: hypothetical protein WB679_17595 [Terracidiphilus sp.]